MNNINELKKVIKSIVTETIQMVKEAHERGEWWIQADGSIIDADGDVGDLNHEIVVIETLQREILEHFGIDVYEIHDSFKSYENTIKDNLIKAKRLTQEELNIWNSSPAKIIIKKLREDNAFKDDIQAAKAVVIAYNMEHMTPRDVGLKTGTLDARDYAMEYLQWKVMKTMGNQIEVQTWYLKPEDLQIIVRGVWNIMGEEDEKNELDVDNAVGEDNYKGPRINLTVQSSGKRFQNIPLAVLEKHMPQNLRNYETGAHVRFSEGVSNNKGHHIHKEYRLYEGNDYIIAAFDDNSRLKFDVHYRNNHGLKKESWKRQAMSKWKSIANELHRDVPLSDSFNPIQKSWKDCFKEALDHPKMKQYIRKNHHQQIFDDKGYPAKVQGKSQPVIDPINFTQRG